MQHTPDDPNAATKTRRRSRLVLWIALGGVALASTYSAIFLALMAREGQSYSWIDAVYWTVTTTSTLGDGDITFSSSAGRSFSVLVSLDDTFDCGEG